MKIKYIIIVIMMIIINSCNTQKSTVNNRNQEDELDKRQEAFDELYDDNH